MIDTDEITTSGEIAQPSPRLDGISTPLLRERVVSGALWLTATRASGQIITWIITIIVIRLLTPADYGLMGMAVLITGILFLFNEIGLGAAIVQKSTLTSEQLSDLRWLIIAVNVGLFALLVVLAPAGAAYFHEPRLSPITRVLAITFLINAVGVPSAALLQREMAFKEKASAEVMGNVAGGIATLLLAWAGYGVWSLVAGSVTLRLVTTVLYCVYRPPVFKRSFSTSNVGLFMQFGAEVSAARFLWYLSSSADVLIVGKLLGSVQLGYYSLAFQYSTLPLDKFVTVLNDIAFPSFSSVQNDTARLQRHYLKLVHFVALVTFPMFIGLLLVSDSAVMVLLGARWLPVVVPLKLLCIVSCFRALEVINTPAIMARGRARIVLINTLVATIVLPVSLYVGARRGGINGVALAWLVTRPFLFGFGLYLTTRVVEVGFARYLRGLRHPLVGSLVMVAVVVTVNSYLDAVQPLARLIVCSLAGCVTYVAYNVLFNSAAVQDVMDTMRVRSLEPFWRSRLARAQRKRVILPGECNEAAVPQASDDTERPRILLAAYHFPPSAAVGGLRISRFARFLPEFGWRPYVLTVNEADRGEREGTDHSRLAGLDGISITRTREFSGILDAYTWIKRKVQSLKVNQPASRALVSLPVRPDRRETLKQRLKRYVTSLFVLLPDEHKNWAAYAVIPAIRLIRRHHIGYILTSAPPHSVHFIGLVAKMFTRVVWIADFRDPWLEMLRDAPPQEQSRLSDRLETWMEARVMHNADKVLTTTERMRQSMIARYPHLPAEKFLCLPNGIDMARLAGSDGEDKYGPLTIAYAGSLYLDRTPEPLFAALSELVNEGNACLDDFRIKLVGNCRTIGDIDTEAVARRFGIAPAVELIDRVPYSEAVQIMRRSHLLLVLAPPKNTLMLPAKIFDYLGSGSKLLALADGGATADLLVETDGGTCFSQNDVAGLKKYLHELLKDGAYRSLGNDPASFRRYDARRLTGQLAAELAERCARAVRITLRT